MVHVVFARAAIHARYISYCAFYQMRQIAVQEMYASSHLPSDCSSAFVVVVVIPTGMLDKTYMMECSNA